MKMAAILDTVVDGTVKPSEVILWLQGKNIKNICDRFQDHEIIRQRFVPFLLDYIHDNCTWVTQSSRGNSTQVGAKFPTPTSAQSKRKTSNTQEIEQCSHQNSPKSPEDLQGCLSRTFRTKNLSHADKQQPLKFDRNTPKSENQPRKQDSISQKGNVEFCKNKEGEKLPGGGTSVPDFTDENSFPPVGRLTESKNTPKAKNIRRITPTPVRPNWRKITINDFLPPEVSHSNPTNNSTPRVNRNFQNVDQPPHQKSGGRSNANRVFVNRNFLLPEVSQFCNNSPSPKGSRKQYSPEVSVFNNSISPKMVKSPVSPEMTFFESNNPMSRNSTNCSSPDMSFGKWTSSFKENCSLLEHSDGSFKNETINNCDVFVNSEEISVLPGTSKNDVHVNDYIMPNKDSVLQKSKLNDLSDLYAQCILEGLVPNVTVELYFLLQLLVAHVKQPHKTKEDMCLFASVHNCVYFSLMVLSKLISFLQFLDRSTLNLLSSINAVAEFTPDFHARLVKLSNSIQPIPRLHSSSIQGVSFQASTDNKENFLTEKSFLIFKKQRDLFYDLFRNWQQHRFMAEEVFEQRFTKQVRHIVEMSSDPYNCTHLARLFITQLITTCCRGLEVDEEGNLGEKVLIDLKHTCPEKLEKLKERLLFPLQVGGPCPSPSFLGSQGFFHDFIKAAPIAPLHQHLKDQLVSKILELNSTETLLLDADIQLEEEARHLFFITVHTLRLLGTFLGFVEFFPYYSTSNIPNNVQFAQKALRNQKPLPLHLCAMLSLAAQQRRLVITLSWVVGYLSMMDPLASSLGLYQETFKILFSIYKSEALKVNHASSFFIKVILGWLFDNANISNMLFSYLPRNQLVIGDSLQQELVDQQLLYSCCPYLGELRILLGEYFIGTKSRSGEVRKITPVSAANQTSDAGSFKQLEHQLEENFFHVHPQSFKKTVDFVGERIGSKAIKSVKKKIIPLVKPKVIQGLQKFLEEIKDTTHLLGSKEMKKFIMDLLKEIKTDSENMTREYCHKETSLAMAVLLPEDTALSVVDVCSRIAYRSAISRALQWLQVNITQEFLKHEVSSQLEKLTKHNNSADISIVKDLSSGEPYYTDPKLNVISELQTVIQDLSSDSFNAGTQHFLKLANHCKSFLKYSTDSSSATNILVAQLLIDCVFCIIVFRPDVCNEEFYTSVVEIFKGSVPCKVIKNIICPRNFHLLSASSNPTESWQELQKFLIVLHKFEVLSLSDFNGCVEMLKEVKHIKNVPVNLSNTLLEIYRR